MSSHNDSGFNSQLDDSLSPVTHKRSKLSPRRIFPNDAHLTPGTSNIKYDGSLASGISETSNKHFQMQFPQKGQVLLQGANSSATPEGPFSITVGDVSNILIAGNAKPMHFELQTSKGTRKYTEIDLSPGNHEELCFIRRKDCRNPATNLEGTNVFYFEDQVISMESATSIVYKGHYISVNRPAAVKCVHMKNHQIRKEELDILLRLNDDPTKESINIVQLLTFVIWNEEQIYFVMELATTDLNKRVQELSTSTEDQYRRLVGYLQDTAKGLKWLHYSCGPNSVIHRDVKPQNILIFITANHEVAKLTDFGISRILQPSLTGTSTSAAGTLDWMCPEAITAFCKNEVFPNKKSMDIFCFGMTCHFTLAKGQHPFKVLGKTIPENIKDPETPSNHLNNDQGKFTAANHLFGWMMMKENEDFRPTIEQVRQHPFFYSSEKSLKFIGDLSKALYNKDCKIEQPIRNYIDVDFFHTWEKERKSHFDWRGLIDDGLLKLLGTRKSECKKPGNKKKYIPTSVMDLIDLIWDKQHHYTDLDEGTNTYFGQELENGQYAFSEKNYAEYFHRIIPDLVHHVYFSVVKSQSPLFSSLVSKYHMNGYHDVEGIRIAHNIETASENDKINYYCHTCKEDCTPERFHNKNIKEEDIFWA